MTIYTYTRTWASNKWDINNPDDVDGSNNPVTLAARIDAALPGKTFSVSLTDNEADITFSAPLTSGEKSTLDTTVADHKAAAGTPDVSGKLNLNSPDGTNFQAYIDDLGAWVIT